MPRDLFTKQPKDLFENLPLSPGDPDQFKEILGYDPQIAEYQTGQSARDIDLAGEKKPDSFINMLTRKPATQQEFAEAEQIRRDTGVFDVLKEFDIPISKRKRPIGATESFGDSVPEKIAAWGSAWLKGITGQIPVSEFKQIEENLGADIVIENLSDAAGIALAGITLFQGGKAAIDAVRIAKSQFGNLSPTARGIKRGISKIIGGPEKPIQDFFDGNISGDQAGAKLRKFTNLNPERLDKALNDAELLRQEITGTKRLPSLITKPGVLEPTFSLKNPPTLSEEAPRVALATAQAADTATALTNSQTPVVGEAVPIPSTLSLDIPKPPATGEGSSPPGKPPDVPIDQPDLNVDYELLKDHWFGEKDWQFVKAGVESDRIRQSIQETTGESRFGKRAQDIDKAIQIFIDTQRDPRILNKETLDKLSPEDRRIAFISQNLTPEQKAIAQEISNQYSAIGEKAQDSEIIQNVLDNYVSRIWEVEPPKRESQAGRKFGTTTRHAKARKFKTILEGQAAGFKLKKGGASTNLNILKEEIHNTIQDKKFLKDLMSLKDVDGNSFLSTKQLLGYKRVEHPNFKVWRFAGKADVNFITERLRDVSESTFRTVEPGDPEVLGRAAVLKEGQAREALIARGRTPNEADIILNGIKNASSKVEANKIIETTIKTVTEKERLKKVDFERTGGKNFLLTPEGTILERKEIYAPNKVAQNLNNIMGVSKLHGIKGIDAITKFNAVAKGTILTSSLFHHLAFMRSFYLGSSPFGEVIKDIKSGEGFIKSINQLTPRQAYRSGVQAIQSLSPEIELLVRNGLTLGRVQDWEEKILREEESTIGRTLDKLKVTKDIKDKIVGLWQMQTDFLFGQFGAGLKSKAALIELRNVMRNKPDIDPNDAAKFVANLMNDDFGGLHLKRLGRNPTTQHIFRLFALAADWTESNIRAMVKAFKRGDEGDIYRRFWARIITKGVMATLAANAVLHTGKKTKRVFEQAWADGRLKWLDVNVTPIKEAIVGKETSTRKYFSILGHFKDPLKFAVDPLKAAEYKGSPVFRIVFDAITGEDWADRQFTEFDELRATGRTVRPFFTFAGNPNKWKTVPSFVINHTKGLAPIPGQNLLNWWAGEMEGFDAVANSLGLGVRTTFELTPQRKAEQKAARKAIKKLRGREKKKKRGRR